MTDSPGPETGPVNPVPTSITGGAIASGAVRVLGGTVLAVPLGLAASILFARLLGTDEYGSFLLGVSVAAFAGTIAQLGLHTIVVREVATARAIGDTVRTRAAVTHSLSLSASVGVGLALLIVSPPGRAALTGAFGGDDLDALVPLIGILAILNAVLVLLAQAFRGLTDLTLATIFMRVWTPLIRVGTFGILALLGVKGLTAGHGLWTLIGASVVGVGLAGAILRRRLPPAGERPPDGYRRRLLRESWPLLLNALLTIVIAQVDIWALAATLERSEIGIYGAAVRVVTLVSLPLVVLTAAMPPFVAHMWARGEIEALERRMRVGATVAVVPAAVATLVLMVGGAPIMSALFGSTFSSASLPLAILAIGHTFNVLTGSCGVALNMTGNQRWALAASMISGVLVVAVIFPVTAAFGVAGAASVAASGRALQNLLAWYFARRTIGVSTHIAPVMTTRLAVARWRDRDSS